jgi:hypothetical protein
MTLTDEDLRAALDHRLRAAGLADDDAIPAPTERGLRLVPSAARSPRARRMATVAAAVLLVAGGALLIAGRRDGASDTQTVPTASTSAPTPTSTSIPTDGRRDALPPPWPMLDTRPADKLDLHGDPIDSEQEFVDRLPELDQQTKDDAAAGRMNVIDQLTGEIVSVDQAAYNAQFDDVTDWYRDHLGGFDGVTMAELDPLIVFTNGSFRIVHRASLDCSPLPDGRTRPACTRFDRHGNDIGVAPRPGGS